MKDYNLFDVVDKVGKIERSETRAVERALYKFPDVDDLKIISPENFNFQRRKVVKKKHAPVSGTEDHKLHLLVPDTSTEYVYLALTSAAEAYIHDIHILRLFLEAINVMLDAENPCVAARVKKPCRDLVQDTPTMVRPFVVPIVVETMYKFPKDTDIQRKGLFVLERLFAVKFNYEQALSKLLSQVVSNAAKRYPETR
jgi:hypothetical protein